MIFALGREIERQNQIRAWNTCRCELREDVWTDLAYDEDARVVEIELYSGAWFAVIGAIPEIESILRSHEKPIREPVNERFQIRNHRLEEACGLGAGCVRYA